VKRGNIDYLFSFNLDPKRIESLSVLIIKNTITEGPGTIGDFLGKEDVPFSIVELGSGEVPPLLEAFDTLVKWAGRWAYTRWTNIPIS